MKYSEQKEKIEQLEKQLFEARKEIESKEALIICMQKASTDSLDKARAEIAGLEMSIGELNGGFNARPKCEKCKTKDKLIEQIRDALKLALTEVRSTHCEETILAALASERNARKD